MVITRSVASFAILQGATITVVRTLLSLGANPHSIPQDLWDTANPETLSNDEELPTAKSITQPFWCSSFYRASLSKRLDFGLKYHLQALSKLKAPTKKEWEIAEGLGTKSLIQAPYFLTGQSLAIKRVIAYIQSHLLLPNRNSPLMLVFAGPPDHGQVELAASIGELISLNSIVSRVRKMNKYPTREPTSSDIISRSSKRGGLEVVLINDLDKISQSNLISLLDGPQQVRTTNNNISAISKIVCIISVTDCESTILDFYTTYLKSRSDDELHEVPWDKLDKGMKKDLIKSFGPTFTSHIDAIIPFFPYSRSETEALAYKYIDDLRTRLASTPISNDISEKAASANTPSFPGGFHLDLEGDDAAICDHIAQTSYDMKLGGRSIQQGVTKEIQLPIIEQWIKKHEGWGREQE
ncbi:hypothetical protein ACJ72_07924, partial [Emergomyces africanus]